MSADKGLPGGGDAVHGGTHTDTEGKPVAINIPDHPARSDSKAFRAAKAVAKKILATSPAPFGPGPWQQHHAGSLWLLDDAGWFLALNIVGGEWSAQWCGDPVAYDRLRANAQRVYAGFPKSIPELVRLGYADAETILTEPITDAVGIARFTDSVYNSCVPLAAPIHVGQDPSGTQHAGWHTFPKSIWDIQFTKRGDFTLFVTDPATQTSVAVVPVAPQGSGDGRVEVLHALAGTALHKRVLNAHANGDRVVLAASNPLAKQAFAHQQGTSK